MKTRIEKLRPFRGVFWFAEGISWITGSVASALGASAIIPFAILSALAFIMLSVLAR